MCSNKQRWKKWDLEYKFNIFQSWSLVRLPIRILKDGEEEQRGWGCKESNRKDTKRELKVRGPNFNVIKSCHTVNESFKKNYASWGNLREINLF